MARPSYPRFRGLDKPSGNRWVVLEALGVNAFTVTELVADTGLSAATVWRHLRALESDGLVKRYPEMAWDPVYRTFRGRQFVYHVEKGVPVQWWS